MATLVSPVGTALTGKDERLRYTSEELQSLNIGNKLNSCSLELHEDQLEALMPLLCAADDGAGGPLQV